MTSTLDPDRLSALRQAKAVSVVSRWFPGAQTEAAAFPDGTALIGRDAAGARTAWVLRFDKLLLAGGAALALALRRSVSSLHVIADRGAGGSSGARLANDDEARLSRRLHLLGRSGRLAITTWRLKDDRLDVIDPAGVAPRAEPVSPAELDKADILRAAGLDVVVEQGVVRGEVLGLEVARVVRAEDGSAAIEAGVGRFDREAGALLNAGAAEEPRWPR